ncbi:MAG: DUF6345 domain-containing protein [Fibromonadaceae bacterium]|nr:DUF6345 domain-containing protein [Fibromonadaceae bacterium]
MKKVKVLVAMFLFMSVSCLALTPWGLPSYVDISAYAVNDYSQYGSGTSNLNRTILHKNRFIEQIQGKLKAKYPNISSAVKYNRENSAATKSNFLNDYTNIGEFVFFSGHGNRALLAFYDKTVSSTSGKSFGGYTRWAMFDACLVLDAPFSKHEPWFDGAHSILGYNSLSYEFIHSYNCFFTCDHYRSEDVFNKFASRFITNGETIWSAHHNSVKEAIYQNGGHGIAPSIVFFSGNADNGQFVSFADERLQNVYNGPFSYQNGASNIYINWNAYFYGNPQY